MALVYANSLTTGPFPLTSIETETKVLGSKAIVITSAKWYTFQLIDNSGEATDSTYYTYVVPDDQDPDAYGRRWQRIFPDYYYRSGSLSPESLLILPYPSKITGLNEVINVDESSPIVVSASATTNVAAFGVYGSVGDIMYEVVNGGSLASSLTYGQMGVVTLDDDEVYDLDASIIAGVITVVGLDDASYLQAGFFEDNTVEFTESDLEGTQEANAATSDSDGDLCVYYDTDHFVIKNRRGGAFTFMVYVAGKDDAT